MYLIGWVLQSGARIQKGNIATGWHSGQPVANHSPEMLSVFDEITSKGITTLLFYLEHIHTWF
jgi:hypothetical protein